MDFLKLGTILRLLKNEKEQDSGITRTFNGENVLKAVENTKYFNTTVKCFGGISILLENAAFDEKRKTNILY